MDTLFRTMEKIVACDTCGLVQTVEHLPPRAAAKCGRCGFTLVRRKPDSLGRTGALALAALILYFPANFYPVITTEYWGSERATTIFDGVRWLFRTGEWPIGCLVFTTSIFTPILKILGLLVLVWSIRSGKHKRLRTWTYKVIRVVDPWNMLEVYWLAIVVAMAEIGRVATVHPGFGVISFTGVVIFTILATLTFDPRLVWDEAGGVQRPEQA